MIIEPRAQSASNILPGHVRRSCQVTYETGDHEPELVWFDIPAQFGSEEDPAGNAWATCLLPLAFTLGERLAVRAPADRLLLRNAVELQGVWRTWHPQLRPVAIECPALTDGSPGPAARFASFFSGGVDSFFTILHQQKTC